MKKEAEKLEFEAWLDSRNFRIWRTNVRSEVSSCASRPIAAIIRTNEIEPAKSVADLKTSFSITWDKLQTNPGNMREIENNVPSEVHVKTIKSKETGIKRLPDVFSTSLPRWFFETRWSRTTTNLTPP